MSLPNNNNGFGTQYTKAFRVINTLVNAENSLTGVELTGAEPYTSVNFSINSSTGAGTFTIYDSTQVAGAFNNLVGDLYITNGFLINADGANTYTLNAYGPSGALVSSDILSDAAAVCGSGDKKIRDMGRQPYTQETDR